MPESGRSNCLPGHWPSERQILVEVKSHHEKFKGMPMPVFLLSQESSFFVKSLSFSMTLSLSGYLRQEQDGPFQERED
jgi:hypothetical protein